VAVKVLRPRIEEDFERAIDTYEWAAARVERMGGELGSSHEPAVFYD
jgi:ubiquinone biosynthesis protein